MGTIILSKKKKNGDHNCNVDCLFWPEESRPLFPNYHFQSRGWEETWRMQIKTPRKHNPHQQNWRLCLLFGVFVDIDISSSAPFFCVCLWPKPKFMAEVVGGKAEKKVMVAIDESEGSHFALVWVLENLKETITNSQLVIFMAQPPTKSNYTFAASLGSARLYCPVSAS